MVNYIVRPLTDSDHQWVRHILEKNWGSSKIVTRGKIYDGSNLPGLIAVEDNKPVGLATYKIENNECEIISMNSEFQGKGIGTALLNAVKSAAIAAGCKRLWLITTNDNLQALRFYQKRGFRIVAVYPNALEESRKLKPEIPLLGKEDIPLRDEIEMEMKL